MMTYKEIMNHITFHRERINELSERLKTTDCADVRRAYINEMMWRAEEIGRMDMMNKKRIMTKLEKITKRLGF
jgi:hypothetical protein